MGKFVKGEVVTLPFPFSNLTGSKKRLAFVTSEPMGDDIMLCQITASRNDTYSIELTRSDFASGSLPQDPSYIRPNKIFTSDVSVILNKNGIVKAAKYSEVRDRIVSIIFRWMILPPPAVS